MADAAAAAPHDAADAWAGDRVARWLRHARGLERQMAPVSELLFAAAAIQPGEAVLDVGCGTGPTTRQAAALAGPSGRVTGLDVSGDMLAAAAADVAGDGARVDWVEADAVAWEPPVAAYEVVISRFGVMFFTDPVAALARMAAATRRGGRFAAAVWAERTESPLFELPYRVALDRRAALGDPGDPLPAGEGPFSWHDFAVVRSRLHAAGWHDVTVASKVLPVKLDGGVGPAAAAAAACDMGPTRLVLEGAQPRTLAAVQDALSAAFADHLDDSGHVVLDATVRIVTATR